MVELKDRRLIIDGRPTLVIAGELHYFRLERRDWEDRVRKLKDLGCNAVASYIPWLVHEPREGRFDLIAVGDFIDLCGRHGLWFLPRPGPFIMAEVKNEGIPFWFYAKHPDAKPTSWNGERATTFTLDYLNPGFLGAVEQWYGAVMPILAERLQPKGGPVVAVQLDNEIGMLQWVSNQPDLSDDTLCDFARWAVERYGHDRYPFDLNDPVARTKGLREPAPEIGPRLLRDYGDFERNRFARYVATLRGYAEAKGVQGVPFIVNVHGSGGGRGTAFPIGIHQLFEAYEGANTLAGSDHYLGELTRTNAQDLYFINAFLGATAREGSPIGSMEFEVGTGDYGETGGARMSGAAADLKARLSVAQGNRLLNYYLLAGGRNPKMTNPPHDGNDRIGNNGERHGFAAPIDPEGRLDPTYDSLQRTTAALNAVADKLADMDEEHDDVALAFMPDYYKTDFHRPGPMREIVQNLEGTRESLETLSRTMLLLGFRFPAVDLQHRPITTRALAFASSRYLDEAVQRKLVLYVQGGGHLLLFGELPFMDMEGRSCAVLAEALGVRHSGFVQASERYYLSLETEDEPEVRLWRAQTFEAPSTAVFSRVADTGAAVGARIRLGKGQATILTGNYPFHPSFYESLFGRMGILPSLRADDPARGTFLTSMMSPGGERMLNLMNLDDEPKSLKIEEKGRALFEGAKIVLPGRAARLLPLSVRYGKLEIVFSTTEILEAHPDRVRFRSTGTMETIAIRGAKTVVGGRSERRDETMSVHSAPGESIEVQA